MFLQSIKLGEYKYSDIGSACYVSRLVPEIIYIFTVMRFK